MSAERISCLDTPLKKSLAESCIKRTRLKNLPVSFYPGRKLIDELSNRGVHLDFQIFKPEIAGMYGLHYLMPSEVGNTKLALPIAQIGFSLQNNQLILENSPQGFTEDRLIPYGDSIRTDALKELKKGWYKDILMEQIINIGNLSFKHGVNEILAVGAVNHPNVDVNGGNMPLWRAEMMMDELYLRFGFNRQIDEDYKLMLPAEIKPKIKEGELDL